MSKVGQPAPASSPSEKSRTLQDRLLWICPLVGITAAAAVLWLFGFTLWTALAFLFLIACPLVVVWILVIERRQVPIYWRKP